MTQNSKVMSLSVKQAKAIPRVLMAKSIEAGCQNAGISKQLFYQWLKKPEFAQEYKRQRDIFINEAMESLKASVSKAVNTLTGLLDSESETLRRAVSNDILGRIFKIKELQDLEDRLGSIERIVLERRTYR
jgi:hypothetical protein